MHKLKFLGLAMMIACPLVLSAAAMQANFENRQDHSDCLSPGGQSPPIKITASDLIEPPFDQVMQPAVFAMHTPHLDQEKSMQSDLSETRFGFDHDIGYLSAGMICLKPRRKKLRMLKYPRFFGLALLSVILFAGLLLLSLVTPSTHAQINPASVPSSQTIDAARLRAYQGSTNALAGVTTNKTFIIPGSLTNTFVIINGIITSVTTP